MTGAFIDIKPGMQVFVTPPDGSTGAYGAIVRSVTADAITLTGARRGSQFLSVEPGQSLALQIHYGGRPYRATATVERVEGAPSAGFTIEPPTSAEYAQRREFFRVDTRITPDHAAYLDEDDGPMHLEETTILDISGGGMRLRTVSPVPAGAVLQLSFPLGDDAVEIRAEALSVLAPQPPRRFFHVHCRFVDAPRQMTERIVRFVFRQQVAENQRRAS
jgi:hypothetical protein